MIKTQIPTLFKERRDQLMSRNPFSCFIIPGAKELLRNPGCAFPFRQDSSFYYLTGLEEPDCVLVLVPGNNEVGRSILFVRPRNRDLEIWDGERYGVERICAIFNVDEAYPIDELPNRLPDLIKSADRVMFRLNHPVDSTMRIDTQVVEACAAVKKSYGRLGRGVQSIHDPYDAIAEMRVSKQKEEREWMRTSAEIASHAHRTVMKELKPGMNESYIEALFDFEIRKQGARRNAYPSIVAGGANACCLHYRFNNENLKEGDLLLIDAGAEFEYYHSDITRTFPIASRFSPVQKRVYELVLEVQKKAIAMVRPGAVAFEIHQKTSMLLAEGLLQLGLYKNGTPEELVQSGAIRRFYPHLTYHYLGIDTHDAGRSALPRSLVPDRPLADGMVITIEPGIYIQPNDMDAPSEWRGIGIRIEDDVLVTESGCEVLSAKCPKEIEELESIRSQG